MFMVFWHRTLKYVLVVRRDDFWTAGPNKCGHVEQTIEYSLGGFKWHTHVKHARAVIELMEVDMNGSKPSPTLGSKYCLGNC